MIRSIKNYLLGGLLVIAASAYSNEELMLWEMTPDATDETITVKAYVPGNGVPLSRVILTEGGITDALTVSVAWADGDNFSVIRNNEKQIFAKTEGTDGFTGALPDEGGDGPYNAFYPQNHSSSETSMNLYLASNNTGNLNPNTAYMSAVSEDGEAFEFKHLTALLKPTFTGIPDNEIIKTVNVQLMTCGYYNIVETNLIIPVKTSHTLHSLTMSTCVRWLRGSPWIFLSLQTRRIILLQLVELGQLYTTIIAMAKTQKKEWSLDIAIEQPVGEGTE